MSSIHGQSSGLKVYYKLQKIFFQSLKDIIDDPHGIYRSIQLTQYEVPRAEAFNLLGESNVMFNFFVVLMYNIEIVFHWFKK